jgi:hypothetical protein
MRKNNPSAMADSEDINTTKPLTPQKIDRLRAEADADLQEFIERGKENPLWPTPSQGEESDETS